MTVFILVMLLLTNHDRQINLIVDPVLMQRADTRAKDLCAKHQWSHDGWLDSFKGYYGHLGENLAKDFVDATSTNKALMLSPTHKANIIDPRFNYIGIGHACTITVELFRS